VEALRRPGVSLHPGGGGWGLPPPCPRVTPKIGPMPNRIAEKFAVRIRSATRGSTSSSSRASRPAALCRRATQRTARAEGGPFSVHSTNSTLDHQFRLQPPPQRRHHVPLIARPRRAFFGSGKVRERAHVGLEPREPRPTCSRVAGTNPSRSLPLNISRDGPSCASVWWCSPVATPACDAV
jgi:hypothetical protein